MNDEVRIYLGQVLHHLRAQGDTTINYKKVKGLLRDLCGEYHTEINVLVLAISEGFVRSLVESPAIPVAIRVRTAASNFSRDFAVSDSVAHWAINSWALALRIIDQEILLEAPSASSPPSANAIQPDRRSSGPARAAALSANQPQSWPAPRVVVSQFGDGDFKSLEAAINNNHGGVSILVRRGTYTLNCFTKYAPCRSPVYVLGDPTDGEVIIESGKVSMAEFGDLRISQCELRKATFERADIRRRGGSVYLSSCRGVHMRFEGVEKVELMDCSLGGDVFLSVEKGVVCRSVILGDSLDVRDLNGISVESIMFTACRVTARSLHFGCSSGPVLFESSEVSISGTGSDVIESQVCLRDCIIMCGRGSIEVMKGGFLTLTRCRLSSKPSQRAARLLRISASGVVKCVESEFSGALAAVDVESGIAEMLRCKFFDNDVGICFSPGSAGKIEGCDLRLNKKPYEVETAMDVQLVNNFL